MTIAQVSPEAASRHGLATNKNNGLYRNGASYPVEKKLLVEASYKQKQAATPGKRPGINAIARECGVSKMFVLKVEKELIQHGEVQPVNKKSRGGSEKKLDDLDCYVLYMLYLEEPSRALAGYRDRLQCFAGTLVSDSTISRFFNHGFMIKASLRKPTLIPLDKFKPANIERAIEYLALVAQINPARLKFTDEKLLKGEELYNRQTRRDPLTGHVPPVLTESDFRNTYSITGICSIDMRNPLALWYQIHDEKNDALSFASCLEGAIATGFLQEDNVVVMDNAAIHTMGENDGIEDWLWNNI